MSDGTQPDPFPRTGVRPYAVAVAFVAASLLLTRVAWPLFGGTPLLPLFGGVVAATHWGSRRAGELAIVLAALGAGFAAPPGVPSLWDPRTLVVFVAVSLIANRVVDGRNRVEAALRASLAAQKKAEQELRASEEHVRRAQKTEAVARLVAGVAHNYNNLLTVILGYSELLIERNQGRKNDVSDLEEIREAALRGTALTRQLLAFGRRHSLAVKRIDIMAAVGTLGGVLSRVVREDIRLSVNVEPEAAVVEIDPGDLQQVVLNLVINSRDALPIGGAVQVDVSRARVEAPGRVLGQSMAPGEYARLRVRDSGVGMTAEAQAHLFEPFFTTKDVGQGTGLGLAFVYGIARQRGGFVTVDTAPGKGTAVAVHFPLAQAAPDAASKAPTDVAVVDRRDATILLVEDESAVRHVTAGILSRAGYRVLPAATPTEASSIFDRHASEIDLLVTDVVMPEMHGPQLAQQLVGRRPDLRVLFVSGHSDTLPVGATAPGHSAFLAKPFASARLVTAVAQLLG